MVIGVALAILFLSRFAGDTTSDQSDTDDADLCKRTQERFGPWIERMRERYHAAFAVGRDYYERTKDEAKRGLASAKSGESHR